MLDESVEAVSQALFHHQIGQELLGTYTLVLGADLEKAGSALVFRGAKFFCGGKAGPKSTLDSVLMGRAGKLRDTQLAIKGEVRVAKADSISHQLAQLFRIGESLGIWNVHGSSYAIEQQKPSGIG
jgi:hypothetical protein